MVDNLENILVYIIIAGPYHFNQLSKAESLAKLSYKFLPDVLILCRLD